MSVTPDPEGEAGQPDAKPSLRDALGNDLSPVVDPDYVPDEGTATTPEEKRARERPEELGS